MARPCYFCGGREVDNAGRCPNCGGVQPEAVDSSTKDASARTKGRKTSQSDRERLARIRSQQWREAGQIPGRFAEDRRQRKVGSGHRVFTAVVGWVAALSFLTTISVGIGWAAAAHNLDPRAPDLLKAVLAAAMATGAAFILLAASAESGKG